MTARLHTQHRKKSSKGVDLRWLAYLAAAGIAVFLIISSGRLGMEMARNRLPEKPEAPSVEEPTIVMPGSGNAPIFLADSPENFSTERPVFVASPAPRVPKIWYARFFAQRLANSKVHFFPFQKYPSD